jgi:hypothetical protein
MGAFCIGNQIRIDFSAIEPKFHQTPSEFVFARQTLGLRLEIRLPSATGFAAAA